MTAVDPIAPERRSGPERTCTVCMEGLYVTKLETDVDSGQGSMKRVGVMPKTAGVLWHIEACSNCGHVQMFRRDWKRGR